MLNDALYVSKSLETNLIYARLIKERILILINGSSIPSFEGNYFINEYDRLLKETLPLANGNISNEVLTSNEIITPYTLPLEEKAMKLNNVSIDTSITKASMNLKSGFDPNPSKEMVKKIENLNKKATTTNNDAIIYLSEIFTNVVSGKIFSYNYPSLINQFIEQTKMYNDLLDRLEQRIEFDPTYVNNLLYKMNTLSRDSAIFIRSLVNQSDINFVGEADKFAIEYNRILDHFEGENPDVFDYLINQNSRITNEFKGFINVNTDKSLNNELYFIVMNIYMDSLLRQINYFYRTLNNLKKDQ